MGSHNMVEKSEQLAAIGNRLRVWRTMRKLTLRQLAALTESNAGNLHKVESGTQGLSLARYELVAKALNVPISLLLDPAAPHAIVGGSLTGTGHWLDRLPMLDRTKAPIIPLPHDVDASAAFYFDVGILFCAPALDLAPFSTEPAILPHGSSYVCLREFDFSGTGRGAKHYELSVRTFTRPPVDIGNALSRAAIAGVPPGKLRRAPGIAATLAAAMGDVPGGGWFTAEIPDGADPRIAHQGVIQSDDSLLGVWPVRATFRPHPNGIIT